jgi:hypothetical protein
VSDCPFPTVCLSRPTGLARLDSLHSGTEPVSGPFSAYTVCLVPATGDCYKIQPTCSRWTTRRIVWSSMAPASPEQTWWCTGSSMILVLAEAQHHCTIGLPLLRANLDMVIWPTHVACSPGHQLAVAVWFSTSPKLVSAECKFTSRDGVCRLP